MTTKTPSDLHKLQMAFPPQAIKQISKSGRSLDYIPVAEVIQRLNDSVQWEVVDADVNVSDRDPDWVVAKVTIRVNVDGTERTHIGYGGQKIKYTKSGDIVDLGDEYKGAFSDALKKATQQIGVGLTLARSEEMLQYEAEQDFEPASEESIVAIEAYTANLSEEKLDEFKAWWKKNVGKRLRSGTVSADDAANAIEHFGIK
jgi:hypothetical protein